MMPEHDLVADPSLTIAYLSEITRGWGDLAEPVAMELRCIFPGRTPDIRRYPATCEGMAELADHAAVMNKHGLNAYVVVNPVRASAPLRRNDKMSGAMDQDIVAAFHFWADGDDEEAANSIRNFAGPRWTMAVTTGRIPTPRPHIYWRCEDPILNLQAWTGIQKAIAARLSTDRTVVNPARIMRLPGTINWPTEKKAAKGRIAELVTLRTDYDDDREPVTFDQMLRAFGPGPTLAQQAQSSAGMAFDIDTGPQAMDREQARIRALSGDQWNIEVFRLVGSYIRAGLSDADIHRLTDPLTLDGYSIDQTRHEVGSMIERTRRNPEFATKEEDRFTPNFDHAPAPTPAHKDTTPAAWTMQRADAFTADFVAPEYIVDGVVQRGKVYTFTAPTGSGKTAVMLYASTAIATGGAFCEREVEHGDVIFLAGENPDDVRARVIATFEFYGIDPASCRLHFIPGTFSIRNDLARLKEEAARLPNLVLVVVDTFAAYFDGEDENSNTQALDFARVVRQITQFPGKPAVIMPAHPVKNASRDNLSPKGGSSLLNEVDGNLTLWNDSGILSMHWHGKFRGAEFDPLRFELERRETELLKDSKGRIMPTILAKPLLELRAIQIARDILSDEDALLLSLEAHPEYSLRGHGDNINVHSTGKLSRLVKRLSDQKLIRKFRSKWELTDKGERAVKEIGSGVQCPPDLEA